jgi:hypothetical protein
MNTNRTGSSIAVAAAVTAALSMAGVATANEKKASSTATGQSIMVWTDLNGASYELDGETTWKFDDDAALGYGENVLVSGPTVNKEGTPPTAPAAPAPDSKKLEAWVKANKCTFYSGGTLSPLDYQQTENASGGWKFTWTYQVKAKAEWSAGVDERTAWDSKVTGGTVDVGFTGFVASESFQKQGSRNKYSFSLMDSSGNSRASDVKAELQKWDGDDWVYVADQDFGAEAESYLLDASPRTDSFLYFANAGVFGASSVYAALHHASGGKAANQVSNILTGTSDGSSGDNFLGNDNDLLNGNVHVAEFEGSFNGLTEPGAYQVVISGNLKGNGGSAAESFSVDQPADVGACSNK